MFLRLSQNTGCLKKMDSISYVFIS
jgi:hypothetical protein